MKVKPIDIQIFQQEVMDWANYFGILSWEINFETFSEKDEDSRATCETHGNEDRIATIALCKDLDYDVITPKILSKLAFHEVLELMFMDIDYIMLNGGISIQVIERETHKLIRTFENSVFETVWAAREGWKCY